MASSGRVTTNTLRNSKYYVDWEITSQSVSGNYSTIKWKAGIITGGDYWYTNAMKINSITINGSTVLSGGVYSDVIGGTKQLASGTKKIYHNDDGEKDISITIKGWLYDYGNCSGSDTWELKDIPRYAKVTQEVSSKTETSMRIRWSSDKTIDKLWYSVSDGSTWVEVPTEETTGGVYEVEGLSPNNLYYVKTKARRKDTGLESETSRLEVTTYNYPYCSETPNFVIGEELTLQLYNPLSRLVTVYFIGANGESLSSDTTSMTTATGYNTDTFIEKLYASIPSSQSGKYQIKVEYGDSVKITNNNNVYSVNQSDCLPIFEDFTYRDNSDIANVTGNNQVLVVGRSNLEVTINADNKMIPQKSALPNKYTATIEGINATGNHSDNDIILNLGAVNTYGTKRLSVTAYDSRNVPKTIYKDITVYEYTKPVINLEVSRLNNFEAQTTLKIHGTYDLLNINGISKNTITSVLYRYRETGGNWSEWATANATITNDKFTCNDVIVSLDNTKAFDIEAKVLDRLDEEVASGSIDVGEAIFIISSNKKTCYIKGKEIMTGLSKDINRTDLNEYTTDIVLGYGHNISNMPTEDLNLGHLISIPRHEQEGFVTQLFSPYTTDDLYIRKCDEGVWGAWKQLTHKVGDIYVTSKNENPSSYLGGTWILVDKEFKPQYLDADTGIFTHNTTNVSESSAVAVLGGHTLRIRLTVVNKIALNDTNKELGTINLSKVGVANFVYTVNFFGSCSDDTSLVRGQVVHNTGVVNHLGTVGGTSIEASKTTNIDFTIPLIEERMLNEFCDKFYWKKTA